MVKNERSRTCDSGAKLAVHTAGTYDKAYTQKAKRKEQNSQSVANG